MSIKCINMNVFIESDADEQSMALSFESGALNALSSFPDGEVFQVDIESARTLTPEEIKERGFEE